MSVPPAVTEQPTSDQADRPAPESEAASQSSQPAEVTANPFPFEEAFGYSPPASKPPEAPAESSEPASLTKPAEASASNAEGAPPDGQQPPEPASRREKAAAREDITAQLAEARKQGEESARAAAEAQQALATFQAQQAEARQQVEQMLGADGEYDRLNKLPSGSLSYEDQQRLDAWKEARERFAPVMAHRDGVWWSVVTDHLNRFGQPSGLEPARVQEALNRGDFGAIFTHCYEAGAASKDAEYAARITELEAELETAKARSTGGRAPELGGASAGGTVPNGKVWNPDLSPDEQLKAAFG